MEESPGFRQGYQNFHEVVAGCSTSQAPTVKPGGPNLRPARLSLQSTRHRAEHRKRLGFLLLKGLSSSGLGQQLDQPMLEQHQALGLFEPLGWHCPCPSQVFYAGKMYISPSFKKKGMGNPFPKSGDFVLYREGWQVGAQRLIDVLLPNEEQEARTVQCKPTTAE